MPFCRKCGFEVGTWMSFCPKCGASLAPLTTQPRWYGYRLTSFYVPNALLWGLLVILWMLQFNAYGDVTWYSQFMWLAFGMAAGLVIGVTAIRKQLNTLTEEGEMGMSPSYLLFMVGGVLVFVGLLVAAMFAFPSLSRIVYVTMMDSIMGANISIILSQAFFVVRWERSHKMRLYHKGMWSLKVYAVPTPDSRNRQSTVSA
jgi:hypothetical protein